MSEALNQNRQLRRGCVSRNATTTAAPRAACASKATNKGGDPEGGIRIALGAAGKSCFEVVARGGYAARTDFPRSLAIAWRSI